MILAVWRHVYRRFEMTYDPLYRGAVFPLAALVAWSATFVGLLRHLSRSGRTSAHAAA